MSQVEKEIHEQPEVLGGRGARGEAGAGRSAVRSRMKREPRL